MIIEPFGYFRAGACGWTDCHDDDEGAIPLWDNAAMCAIEKQRDELLAALERIVHYYDLANSGSSLPPITAQHEMFGEARKVLNYGR